MLTTLLVGKVRPLVRIRVYFKLASVLQPLRCKFNWSILYLLPPYHLIIQIPIFSP